jgi:protein-L-isoaspartate O-methyltransferase
MATGTDKSFFIICTVGMVEQRVLLLLLYLREEDVVVDVGANLGFVTGVLTAITGKRGQVHSFEPSPPVFAKLLEVIEASNYGTLSPYNMGCDLTKRP